MSEMSLEERRRNLRPGDRVQINSKIKKKHLVGKTGRVKEILTVKVELESGEDYVPASPKSLDPIAGE